MKVIDLQATLNTHMQRHVLKGGDARGLEIEATVLTDAAIDRALRVWREEGDVAYAARINNYLHSDSTPDIAALQAADTEAEQLNRDLMRRAIKAALA